MTEEERGWAKAQLSALEWLDRVIVPSHEPVTRTKENVFKCFQAFVALIAILNSDPENFEEGRLMHPALQSAFEAAYPHKHPAHQDLVTIGFDEFFGLGLGDEHFTRLLTLVEGKCRELVASDTTLKQHWAAFGGTLYQPLQPQESDRGKKKSSPRGKEPSENPAFQSAWETSQAFDSMRWMFEERQDILAAFVHQLGEPSENLQPKVFGTRARRE
ncbi:hypothetical protein PG996_005111 [Apiospora saccharicola]|uniref:Uncharacterized protein n=1 Tax=Apiospora saccharicola TaxID=335842 RepID=A0ABR1VPJ3_9PEZI